VRALLLLLAFAVPASAQEFTYRGFVQIRSTAYPQTTPQDDRRTGAEALVRVEPAYKPADWLTLSGSVDARTDTFEQVERKWRIDLRDRGVLRPALSLRHATASIRRGTFTADLGKQFVRWGKADILNPTDRFAPRDFIEVTNDEFLAVNAVRGRYERGAHTLDVVWVPMFTPSRLPLLGRRWAPVQPQTLGTSGVLDPDSELPDRAQYGARWNVLGRGLEFSFSYFDGFNHLPEFTAALVPGTPLVALRRTYAPLRMGGADAAVPLRWFTLKGEIATMLTTSASADDVVIYVVQLERQSGELSLVWGYAGEIVVDERSTIDFAPDRGLARAFLGRAGYTLGATSDVSFEVALRQNLDGVWVKGQYSKAAGAHWRATLSGAIIGGGQDDFIGQYRRNSHVVATLRYSF
jgi:hypothetical protein